MKMDKDTCPGSKLSCLETSASTLRPGNPKENGDYDPRRLEGQSGPRPVEAGDFDVTRAVNPLKVLGQTLKDLSR